ncbi:hypothetical protein [Roseibium sp. SCP14]|uniref:hypothetical protein n=1 Tax=Roseibium sp. SCP14 TaxID=3141375 RepID=UPI00333892C3
MYVAERSSRRPLPHSAKTQKPDTQATSWNSQHDVDEPETNSRSQLNQALDLPVSPDLIKSALKNALASSEFQSAPQLRSFLGFVVHATLSNSQEKIKGYTIAVEALGRSEDFNPVTDPIVRVEAARLRRRLDTYYAGSGAGDPVRIAIPKGSYAPQFSRQNTALARGTSAPDNRNAKFELDPENLLQENVPSLPLPMFAPGRDEVPFLSGLSSDLPEFDQFKTSSPNAFAASAKADRAGTLFSRVTDMQRLPQLHLPLPFVIILALGCFVVGYLAGIL